MSRYWIYGKEVLEIERGNTRSHCVEDSLRKTFRKLRNDDALESGIGI